jgi:hypothetical protein
MRTDRELSALFAGALVEERPDPTFLDELFQLLVEEVAEMDPSAAQQARALPGLRRVPRWPLLAAASIVIAILALGVLRLAAPQFGPPASPAPTPTPSPIVLSNTFTAPIHAYTGALPAGWSVTLGTTASAPDTFVGPAGTLVVRFTPIPGGTSQDTWSTQTYTSIVTGLAGTCLPGNPDAFSVGHVGTVESLRYELPCLPGWLDLTAVGDRGYDIRFTERNGAASASDVELYREILLGFTLGEGPTVSPSPAGSPAPS